MRAIGSANAGLPDPCELNTSTGTARSLFEVTFTTDIAYPTTINGPVDDAQVQLSHPSGSGPVFLLDHFGGPGLAYDEILSPNTYTIRAPRPTRTRRDYLRHSGHRVALSLTIARNEFFQRLRVRY